MANNFSKKSSAAFDTLHPDLQKLMVAVLQKKDFTILEGFRNEAAQNAAFATGKSKLKWPNGQHNKYPSHAVDIAPFPIDWNNLQAFKDLAKLVLEEAEKLGISVRWGGDFNMNSIEDDKFVDMPHFELRSK